MARASGRTSTQYIDPLPVRQMKTGAKWENGFVGLSTCLPWTGKSKVILFIRRFFTEAPGWKYVEDSIYVAFQKRVAYAMDGETLHTAGKLEIGSQPRLSRTDADVLFTRNRHLKWVLVDEVGMVSDLLLCAFECQFTDASDRETRYKFRGDGSPRPFGGYNLLTPSDFVQLTPLPQRGSDSCAPIGYDQLMI